MYVIVYGECLKDIYGDEIEAVWGVFKTKEAAEECIEIHGWGDEAQIFEIKPPP